jgi:CDP-diglyceride synthetase
MGNRRRYRAARRAADTDDAPETTLPRRRKRRKYAPDNGWWEAVIAWIGLSFLGMLALILRSSRFREPTFEEIRNIVIMSIIGSFFAVLFGSIIRRYEYRKRHKW